MSDLLPSFFLQSGVNKNKKKKPEKPESQSVIQITMKYHSTSPFPMS